MKTPAFEVGTAQLNTKYNTLSAIAVSLHSAGTNSRKYCVDYIVSRLSENEVGCENSIQFIAHFIYLIFNQIETPATSFFRSLIPFIKKTIKTKTMYATVLEEGKRILMHPIDAILIRSISPLPLLNAVIHFIKDKKCWLSYVFVKMKVGIDFLQVSLVNFHIFFYYLSENRATSFYTRIKLMKVI